MASASPKRTRGRPPKRRVGRTIAGIEYLTTHICPKCEMTVETIGGGYPQLVCCKCRMHLVAKPEKVEKT